MRVPHVTQPVCTGKGPGRPTMSTLDVDNQMLTITQKAWVLRLTHTHTPMPTQISPLLGSACGASYSPQPETGCCGGASESCKSHMAIVPFNGSGLSVNFHRSFGYHTHMQLACLDDEWPDAKRRRSVQVSVSDALCAPADKDAVLNVLKTSITVFLANLAIACTSIPGEQDSIESETDELMYVARQHLADGVATIIASGCESGASLKRLCVDVYKDYALKAIKLHRIHLGTCVDGIDMIAIMAASSHRVDDVTNLLIRHYATIKKVCSDPPRALLESMAAHGIASTVLAVLFNCCGPSIAHAARILCQYMATTAHRLHDACMDAVRVLRARLQLPLDSLEWSQIELCSDTNLVDSNEVCGVPPPLHLSSSMGVTTLARVANSCGALRIPRFIRAFELCVSQVDSADLWGKIDVDCVSRELRKQRLGARRRRVDSGSIEWVCPDAKLVPEELKRDFNILVAMQTQIPMGAGMLDVAEVAKLMMTRGAFFAHDSTQRSVEQAVHHVMRKSVYQVCKRNKDGCGIEYVKGEGVGCSIGHLRMDAAGSAMLRTHVREILECMVSHSRKIRSEWKASRSSRSTAAVARRTKGHVTDPPNLCNL